MTARIVRYAVADGPRWGLVTEEQVVRELHGDPYGRWEPGPEVGPLAEVHLLAPVLPSKILCVGRNYPAHAAEHGSEVPPEPLLFLKPPSAVIGPEAPIRLPPQSARVDYEAELAAVSYTHLTLPTKA